MIEDKKTITDNIAENIAYYRKQLNLTQLELAEILNYSDKSISKWERAEGTPDVYVLNELAQFFGVSLDQLVNKHKAPIKKKRKQQTVAFFYALIIWVVAVLTFAAFTIANVKYSNWKLFIYAIPLSSLVLLIFNIVWKKVYYIYLYTTITIWTLALSLSLIFTKVDSYLFYIIAIPVYILSMFFTYLKFHTKTKKNNIFKD